MSNKIEVKKRISVVKEHEKCIPETDYINIIIINNINENQIFNAFSLVKLIHSLKEENFNNILISFHYLCNSNQLFNKLNGKEYLSAIFHIFLYVMECDDEKLKNQKKIFLDDIILLIEKLFLSKKLNDKDLLLLLKFISFTSMKDRKEIYQHNIDSLVSLSNNQIKNYKRFQYVFEIIKKINYPKLTYDYFQFLQKNIFKNKENFFLFGQKLDLLNFLFLDDPENKIMTFLSEIYSFKFNRHFLNIFINEIIEAYDIKNKNTNSIEILNKLNKSILFLTELKKYEDIKYEKDQNMLPKCFVLNNNKYNGIYVNNIQMQNNFSLIFSFCLSPNNAQTNKKDIKEYPIISLIENNKNEKNYLSFHIKEGVLYFKHFNNEQKKKICNIELNQTYLCYYRIKEKDCFIQVINKEQQFLFKNKFQYQLKKNILLQIGKLNQQNFEGYMGPVLIFRKHLDDLTKNIFALKGLYEKALYFKDFDTNEIDIYDKFSNSDPEKYLELKRILQGKDELSKSLAYYITPIEEGQSLNKLNYYNTSFIETKVSYYKEPKIENGATYFLFNKYSVFEFLKFEGLNYIILILELITTNVENIKEDKDKETVLNTFKSLIFFLIKIFESINIDYFINEIRNILFSIQKCVNKICQKIKMTKEMSESLKNFILFMTSQKTEKQNKNNQYFIYMRNETCKFLLNIELYDLSNFYTIEYFLCALNNSLIKNCNGLTSMDIYKKIMTFTVIYNQNTLPKKDEIMHTKEFKSIKHELNNSLINYLSKCDKLQPFNEIFQSFSKEYNYNYKNYQMFKIFYLCSEYFLGNEINKSNISVLKYFIDLYNNLEESNINSKNETQKKQIYIIMALCLRIFLEYNIKENPPKRKEKKIKVNVIKRFSKTEIKNNNFATSAIIPKDKLLSLNQKDDNEININNENKNKNEIEEKKSELKDIIVSKKENNEINIDANKNTSDNKNNINNYKTNYTSNTSNVSENTNNFKTNNTDSTIDDQNNIIRTHKKRNSSINLMSNNNNEMEIDNSDLKKRKNSDEDLDNKINVTLNSKITEKYKFNDYFSFQTIFQNLFTSKNFNDYSFKSIFLFLLEKNNNITIPQKIKYKFIIKTKKYEDLKDTDYQHFLKINYYNEETKEQLIQLLDLLEKNNKNLSRISYEIFIYLIISIAKNRQNNECVFRHFFMSRKICCKIFSLIFLNNKESSDTLINIFQEMLELILPYHKKPFIYSFLYNSMTKNELIEYGKKLINIMLKININNQTNHEFFYLFKINCVILLYRIIKTKNIDINEKFILDNSLQDLFNIDLATSKYNILKDISNNRKKTHIELLFEILIVLYLKTKNENYYNMINNIFINNKNIKKNSESKSILYYLDTYKKLFKNKILKNYEVIEDRYYTLLFLYKSLKYWMKSETNELKNKILNLIKDFYNDAKLFYKEYNSKLKKLKTKNELFLFVKKILEENTGKDKSKYIQAEALVLNFREKYNELKKKDVSKNLNKTSTTVSTRRSFFKIFDNNNMNQNDVNNNLKNMELNDSFSSCKSTKSQKENCKTNKKKRMKFIKKKNINELLDDEEAVINLDDNEDINIENKNNIAISINKELSNISKELSDTNINIFSLDYIDSPNKVILFPKLSLLEQIFATYFTKIFFYNEPFINMKNYFKYKIKKDHNEDISIDNFFNYPIIIRNYIPNNLYFGGLFVKHDLNFFANRYFHISHTYFINKAKQSKRKRIFPKISEQNDILNYIMDKNEKTITFIVDLITNRNVYFGELIISKHLIYFHNIDKDRFFKGKSDEEIEDYLLCSMKCDYSIKNKKLYIFKKEITEIVNRRFLYLFQACEFYLKNGKSYYFNFYSEENKIKFFSLFGNKDYNPYNIKIISDLKTDFKKRDYTNQWLKNNISTLEYLLFINKYSCRSYNDVNQYPVFPWVRLIDDNLRDLKNTIAAQKEEQRMMLMEKYSLSSETFPYHYTTHYTNASFLIYYLVRINPFTDNQITLQDNKFDSPGRQFNSIDELLKILSSTSQPREIIPEFFITTEFYINYNCNFFGIKNKINLINNLENKKGYDSPLDYILSNAVTLELPETKSEINYFFDNIFGVGQIGKKENCNTYDKYSYQEMVDLRQKLSQYKQKKLSLKEIKIKIDTKSNKIISFGQTPFKLLEDKHPQWKDNSTNNDNSNNAQSNAFEAIYSPSSSQKIIFVNESKNAINKKYIYVLFYNYKEKNYEIKFFSENLKEENNAIQIKKKLKLFSKLRLFNNDNFYLYKYNPKLLIIDFNMTFFIYCRLNDKSFCTTNIKGESKYYLTESIVTCLCKSSEKSFFTGHNNGKVIEWKFNLKSVSNILIGEENNSNYNINILLDELIIKRKYIAHTEKVSGIYCSELLGLIITSGDDNKIMIRKYYDLTLLTMIDLNVNNFCVDLKISHCFLYILFYDESVKKQIVQIYSVNGLKVGEGSYNYINGINFDQFGNVLIGHYKENKIEVYNPSITQKLDDINIDLKHQSGKKISNDQSAKKRRSSKRLSVDKNLTEEIYFTDFIYDKMSNMLYCSFSNGQMIKKKYKCNKIKK